MLGDKDSMYVIVNIKNFGRNMILVCLLLDPLPGVNPETKNGWLC